MDDIIQKLIEFDRQCVEKVELAKKKKAEAQSSMMSQKSTIYSEYIDSQQDQVEKHKQDLLNKNKEEVFYHRAGTSKENKLCTWGDIYKTATNYKTSPKVLRYYKDALLHNGKFYLSFTVLGSDPLYDTSYITEVNLKNGKPIIYEKEEFTAYISMWTFNNKLEYQGYGTENDGYDSDD